MEQLLNLLGKVIAYGGGIAAIFFMLFQYFGKAWLENKFSQRLHDLRHQQEIEVARLRVEIDSMLNGALRLQEKEFEILPTAWGLLEKSVGHLTFVTSPFQTYADIDRMSNNQVEELLHSTKFTESQKKDVRESQPKSRKYVEYIIQERVYEAHLTINELLRYLSANGILMPLDIKEKLNSISSSLNTISHRVRNKIVFKLQGGIEDYSADVEALKPLHSEIESLIQKRLASHAQPITN